MNYRTPLRWLPLLLVSSFVLPCPVKAEPPGTAYIFPAGGPRGSTVNVRVGGYFLYDKSEFLLSGSGVEASSHVERTKTVWLEGPLISQPASQQKEDYPKDYSAQIKITPEAAVGIRHWHCATSQGITPAMRFVVGTLPEVVEDESNRTPAATPVALPITINGRIFPREDVDDWSFDAKAGQVVTCEVNAARLGSGLDARLEVLAPNRQVVVENSDTFGADPFVRFTAPEDGKYIVRIHDVRFEGFQHFVYRLTVSSGAWLDHVYPLGGRQGTTLPLQLFGAGLGSDRQELAIPVAARPNNVPALMTLPFDSVAVENVRFETDDLAEHLEVEPNDELDQVSSIELPAVFNGRIERAGDADLWKIAGKKGDTWTFDLRASRLGSSLDGVLTVLDERGQKIATADDLGNGQTDATLTTTLPADGVFALKVEDRISTRGGLNFAYRVRVTRASEARLKLATPLDAVTVLRGGETRIKVLAERPQGMTDEIALSVEGLPEGVSVAGNKINKGQNQVDLVLKATDSAKVMTSRLKITGHWKVGEDERSVVAGTQQSIGESELAGLLLRVGVPTPFKLKGIFESKYASRGSVFVRKYQIERNGFAGPLSAELADRQARHLQGVTGPKLTLATDQTEFDFPFTLPSWMEIGRTSRSCVALIGEVTDPDGTKHVVSHTSQNQDDQAIVIVEPNRMSLQVARSTVRWVAGTSVRLPIQVARGTGLRGPVRVEVLDRDQVVGVSVDHIAVPDGMVDGEVTLRFADDVRTKVASSAIKLTATMRDERGFPITDEVVVQVIDVE